MAIEQVRDLFLWCLIINAGLLLVWLAMYLLMGKLIHKVHSKLFPMSRETFGLVMYCGLGLYKLLVVLLVFVPWLALLIVT